MKANLNFYDEIINIILPQTFEELKLVVCERFLMEWNDVNELIYSYSSNDNSAPLSNEKEYQTMLKFTNFLPITINIEVSQKSQLFKKEEKNFIGKCQDQLNNIIGGIKNNFNNVKDKVNNFIKKEEKVEEPKVIEHSRVICDGCGMKPLVGVRYKCTVCKNFDYCENCEKTKGAAHQHPFLKIRKPELAPVQIKCFVNHA